MNYPADLERAVATFITNAVANTVNAGIAVLAAPPNPPSSRYRIWGFIFTVNHSTSAPGAAAFSRIVIRDATAAAQAIMAVNTNAPQSEIYFPGGRRMPDNSSITLDNNSSAVSQSLALVTLYTIERV